MQAREKLPSAGAAHLCIMQIPFRGKLPYNEWENIQGENRNMSIIFFDIDGTVMDLDGTIPPSAVTAVRRLRQAGLDLPGDVLTEEEAVAAISKLLEEVRG